MNRHIGNLTVASVISATISIFMIYWLIIEDEDSRLTSITTVSEVNYPGIKSYGIELRNKTILLNVKLSHPLTCKQVIDTLSVEDLTIRERTYAPVCELINPTLAVITYHEVRSI